MAGAHVWAAKIAAAVVVLAAAGCRADEPRFGGPESDTRHRRQRSDVRDAEAFAETFGWPKGLPTLDVHYGLVHVNGAKSQFNATADHWLGDPPTASWGSRVCGGPCAILMVDPDAPDRSSDRTGRTPGRWGPWLHGLWSDCYRSAGKTRCKTDVRYWPPNPPEGNHRYIFMLLKQTGGEVTVTHAQRVRKQWDVKGFLSANPGLEPAAINFFYTY